MTKSRKLAIAALVFIVIFAAVVLGFKVLDWIVPAIGPINTIALILAGVFALIVAIS